MQIDRPTKCFICKKMMEVGESFRFVEIKNKGRISYSPVHPIHLVDDDQRAKLRAIAERANETL